MPRLSADKAPSYRLHRQSGQAVVTLNGRDHLLGPHGSGTSKAKYDQLIAEWFAAGRRLPFENAGATVAEIVNAYRKHADVYYRRGDGTRTGEADRIVRELSPLTRLHARLPAHEFSPLKLKAVREAMITAGWVRTSINHAVGTIRRMMRWAVENEIVTPTVLEGLRAVAGLKRGRSEARESAPVRPVLLDHINAILPHVPGPVKAMIELQLATGMRSGEVCTVRGSDIDRTRKVWTYRPVHHKTQHHGQAREVYLGPKAQQIIAPFLKLNPDAYLFDPRNAVEERRELRHRQRITPLSSGNRPGAKLVRNPKRGPGHRYDVGSYRRAIARACDAAFPPPDRLRPRISTEGDADHARRRLESKAVFLARLTPSQCDELAAWQRAHRWHPHRIRHSAATRLRKEFGLEAAQLILGHKSLAITELYAEKNAEAAQRIMAAVG